VADSVSVSAARVFRKPHLDQRLPGDPEAARVAVEGLHHPGREIHVDTLGIDSRPMRLLQVELIRDLLARIELQVKLRRFSQSLPFAFVFVGGLIRRRMPPPQLLFKADCKRHWAIELQGLSGAPSCGRGRVYCRTIP